MATNSATKIMMVPILAALITVLGMGSVLASEVGGTVSSGGQSSSQESYTDGGMVGTVEQPSASGSTIATDSSAPQGNVSSSGGRSRSRTTTTTSNEVMIILDDGSMARAADYSGVGGGYDPYAESVIARANAGDSLSSGDAIAYNTSLRSMVTESDLVAGAGDSGLGSVKTWTAIVLGLSLVGLAGYAVSALMAYRRENDL